jgi:hypothetical protein
MSLKLTIFYLFTQPMKLMMQSTVANFYTIPNFFYFDFYELPEVTSLAEKELEHVEIRHF